MNKLIPGARFSSWDAREQRIREAIRNGKGPHGDVRSYRNMWDRAAEALHKNDPSGRKLARLLREKS